LKGKGRVDSIEDLRQEGWILDYMYRQNAQGSAVAPEDLVRDLGLPEADARAWLTRLHDGGLLRLEPGTSYYQIREEAWDRLDYLEEQGYI
jgi:DNA-binding IclR family transcriptional regulator